MRLFIFACILSYGIIGRGIGFDAGADPIQVVIDTGPLSYMKDGRPQGTLVDLTSAVLDGAGINVFQIDIFPWARSYQMALTRKNVMILAMARTKEREGLFKWAGAVLPVRYEFLSLKKSGIMIPDSLEDFKSHDIGVRLEDVSHQYLIAQGFVSLFTASRMDLLIKMLDKERVDLILVPAFLMGRLLRDSGSRPSPYRVLWTVDDLSTDLYAAFSLATNDDIVRRVQKSLARVISERRFDPVFIRP